MNDDSDTLANRVRADNVGSLLRPPYLLDARHAHADGDELRELEDRAVIEAIALQEEIGLPILTDGEYRRRFFFSTIEVLVDGIDPQGYVRHHRDAAGREQELRTPTPVKRLKRTGTLAEYELRFVREHTSKPVKVAMPSPSLLNVYWTEGVSDRAYGSRQEYLEHLIELMNEDAKLLAAQGARYIQLDAPHYAYIQKVMAGVEDRDAKLRELVEYDNRVFEGVEGAVTCLHICRGNDRSHFTGTEPYDEFAASIFPHAVAERLLLEYDDERSGGFAPLRYARDDQTVVLGLVTSKRSELERPDELKRRIEEAARYLPLDRLALSTQCGFASNAEGNAITWDAQRAKLELVLSVARDVWGDAGGC
ncbi:MAG TPA: cobalamin-independent methionine synthase II family protein [Solirubrobacteraceae bacterium]|nr:cobalamin-independent methionine synthase II family protein [Solirubrobacteraceae bacterium]